MSPLDVLISGFKLAIRIIGICLVGTLVAGALWVKHRLGV